MSRAAFVAAAKAKLLSAEASAAVDDNKVKLYLQGGDEVDVRPAAAARLPLVGTGRRFEGPVARDN